MTTLTDLEICKRIAEIDGAEHLCDRGVVILSENYSELINTICSGRYSPEQVIKIIDKAAYNPLTDDALCFQLMVKYKVALDYTKFQSPLDYYCSWVGDVEIKSSRNYKSPNKAILLAIIEANKES